MTLNLQDKKVIVSEVSKIAKNALSAVIVSFSGVSVENITKLRKAGREVNVHIRVVRNTLLNRAIKGTAFECLQDKFIGQTMIAFSMKHVGAAARLFKEFTKFEIKAGAFEGKIIPLAHIDYLATLPSYEEAVMRFILILQEISIVKLIRTLSFICDKKKQCSHNIHVL